MIRSVADLDPFLVLVNDAVLCPLLVLPKTDENKDLHINYCLY